MAFLIKQIQPGGHSGKISIDSTGEAVEVWTVIADDVTYSTEDVRLSGIFPAVYESFHPQNSRLRLQPISIQQNEDNPALFVCTLTWNSDTFDPPDEAANPLDRKAKITVATQFDRETKHRDFYGKPKVNAAGDLFDPPIENNRMVLVISIRKNVVRFPDWVFEFADCVNSQPFVIRGRRFDTGVAWIASISLGEEQFEQGYPVYCEARLEIHIKKRRKARNETYESCVTNDETEVVTCRTVEAIEEDPEDVPLPWDTEQLNEGLVELVRTGGTDENPTMARQRIKIRDPDDPTGVAQVFAPCPVPLDATGRRLQPVTIDNATFIVFRDHEYRDFNQISYLWGNA